MIGVIATLRIQDGKAAAFERTFGELAAQVRANEPGNLAYQLKDFGFHSTAKRCHL